jgi:CHASE2 domain-containing sensor protein
MMTFIPPRLRKPAVYALAGLLLAAAWLVRGGPLWWAAVIPVIFTAANVVRLYRLGAKDTDDGARAGSRADERQQLVSLRSRALACNLAAIASFIGLAAAIAARAGWWWPFLVTLLIAGYGYVFGLATYGDGEEDALDDRGAGRQASHPLSS